ncbi:MAG: VCBS repeat-containing protein [Lentisphaeria bacterium]|nr:VCBS repeat-containing protein [Lentisphaeria bacterium]
MKDFATDPNYLEGTINGRPIAGYHFVQYGETQEYLESLNKAGVVLVYREDNPPEEGKLTLTKPNPEPAPGTITISPVANPGEIVVTDTTDTTVTDTTDTSTDPNNWADGPGNVTVHFNSDYSELVPTKLIALAVFPDLPLEEIPTDITEYFAKFFPNQSLTENYSDETIVELQRALDNFIASSKADTTTDPSYNLEYNSAPADTTVTDTTNNVTVQNADPGLCGPQPQIIIDPEYAKQLAEQFKNVKIRLGGFGEGPVHFHLFYDSEESDTPSRFELVRIGDSDWTNEQVASFAASMIEKSSWDEQQKALMREAVDEFRANPKMAQSYYEYQRSLTIISTMDAETAAVTSVQVASAEDGGWRTIGTLNNPDGIDWKYQAGNLTGSGTASVVWHAQELGALGVWTDGTDNWTAVDGWFDANWTMLGCGDFDGDGKDSVLMSLNGGLFYSVDLDGTLSSLGGLNWSGWEFGAVGDFAGDGKDDIVLFHRESGTVVLLADGNADAFERLGQLDATDWSVAGAGDFDADGKDDLLVRQNSTGIAGAYASADMSKWSTVSSDYLLA